MSVPTTQAEAAAAKAKAEAEAKAKGDSDADAKTEAAKIIAAANAEATRIMAEASELAATTAPKNKRGRRDYGGTVTSTADGTMTGPDGKVLNASKAKSAKGE